MAENDGGPAFAVPENISVDGSKYYAAIHPGMSLRDYFAGQALIGFLASYSPIGEEAREHPFKAATWAYEQANAMLKAREISHGA